MVGMHDAVSRRRQKVEGRIQRGESSFVARGKEVISLFVLVVVGGELERTVGRY